MAKKKKSREATTADPEKEAPPAAEKPSVEEPPKKDSPKEEKPKEALLKEEKPKEEKPKELPKATPKPAKKGDWYDSLLAKGKDAMKELPPQVRGATRLGLEYLEKNKADMIDLGEEAFEQMLNLLGTGAKGKARDLFIRTKLGPDGLIAAMKKNNDAMKKGMTKRAEFDAQFMAFLKDVGTLAVNVIRSVVFV